MRTLILGGLLASAMLVPALAQTSNPSACFAGACCPVYCAESPWRDVAIIEAHRPQRVQRSGQKLGAISEILLDKSGKVDFVVIGVGGFLGIGQHDIMVEMSKLKFVDEPVRTSSTTTGTTGSANRPATTTTNRLRRPQR